VWVSQRGNSSRVIPGRFESFSLIRWLMMVTVTESRVGLLLQQAPNDSKMNTSSGVSENGRYTMQEVFTTGVCVGDQNWGRALWPHNLKKRRRHLTPPLGGDRLSVY